MKPKVLFIIHLPPPLHGASMVNTFIRQSEKIEKQFDCDYINLATSKELSDIGRMRFFKVFTFLTLYWKVLKAVSTKKYDLSFVTLTAKTPAFYKDLIIVLLLKLFRQKHIFLFHNKGVAESGHKNGFNNFLYRLALKNTPSIQLSKYLYSDIQPYVKQQQVYFLPNGIPEIKQNGAPVTARKENPCKLLFLSNMMEEKGVYVLIEACRQLKEQKVGFECHFVGAWYDVTEEEFDDLIRQYDLGHQVFAHGKQYGEDKVRFFSAADLFVFPTFYHNECFPLVLLEAMQFGLPIVTTQEGGIPDIVVHNETGYLVPRQDPAALAEKLRALIEDKTLRQKMGRAAEKRFDEKFQLKNFEDNLVGILEDVINK
jgi:glycosyltransferase involved in cell wall biosynthesis